MIVDITEVIKSLAPGAAWSLDGSEIMWETDPFNSEKLIPKNLTWYSQEIPAPTKEQIDSRRSELQAISDSLEYQRLRRPEYPPLADLADALYWQAQGDNSKMNAYIDQIAAVKARYPKGT